MDLGAYCGRPGTPISDLLDACLMALPIVRSCRCWGPRMTTSGAPRRSPGAHRALTRRALLMGAAASCGTQVVRPKCATQRASARNRGRERRSAVAYAPCLHPRHCVPACGYVMIISCRAMFGYLT